MDINHLLDTAKAKLHLSSDRQLAIHLRKDPSYVYGLRQGRTPPSDDAWAQIADLAGLDGDIEVLRFMAAKAKGRARRAYTRALKALAGTAATILIFFLATGTNPVTAHELDANAGATSPRNLYIMRHLDV